MHLVVFADLPNELAEGLVDVNPLLSGGFDELATKVFGEITTLWKTKEMSK
jgi:hypothetical protein